MSRSEVALATVLKANEENHYRKMLDIAKQIRSAIALIEAGKTFSGALPILEALATDLDGLP